MQTPKQIIKRNRHFSTLLLSTTKKWQYCYFSNLKQKMKQEMKTNKCVSSWHVLVRFFFLEKTMKQYNICWWSTMKAQLIFKFWNNRMRMCQKILWVYNITIMIDPISHVFTIVHHITIQEWGHCYSNIMVTLKQDMKNSKLFCALRHTSTT